MIKRFILALVLSMLLVGEVSAQAPTRAFSVCDTTNFTDKCDTPAKKQEYFDIIYAKLQSIQTKPREDNNCPLSDPNSLLPGQVNSFYNQCWNDPTGQGVSVREEYFQLVSNQCQCYLGEETTGIFRNDFNSKLGPIIEASVTGTPPPRPTDVQAVIPTPTPNSLDLQKFNEQLDNTMCTGAEGTICCIGTDPMQIGTTPDLTNEAGIGKNGFISKMWAKMQVGLMSFVSKAQGPSTAVLNEMSTVQGMCSTMRDEDTGQLIKLLPYLSKDGQLATYQNSDSNIYVQLSEMYKGMSKLSSERKSEKLKEIRELVDSNGYTCTCSQPSPDNMSVPLQASSERTIGMASKNVLGESIGEILGSSTILDPNVTDKDEIEVSTLIYCNQLKSGSSVEYSNRFKDHTVDECKDIMIKSVKEAHYICGQLKGVTNDAEEYGNCFRCTAYDDGVWTSIGCMYSDFSKTLNEKIFTLGISIAGLGALGSIIYAAFLMQISAGNPEKTAKAQEIMTAAITGLVIVIFSIFILRVIGVDILRIPGFGSAISASPTPPAAGLNPTTPPRSTPTVIPAWSPGSSSPSPRHTPTPWPTIPAAGILTPAVSVSPNTPTPWPTIPAAAILTSAASVSPNTPTPVPTVALSANDCDPLHNPGSSDIYLFDRTNFSGPCLHLTIGTFADFNNLQNKEVDFTNLWSFGQCDNRNYDDCIASIKVGSEVQIELHDSKNNAGTAIRIKESTSQLQSSILDNVSSAKVCVNPNKSGGAYICP